MHLQLWVQLNELFELERELIAQLGYLVLTSAKEWHLISG